MHKALLIRAGGVLLCLLASATASFSQPSPIATPSPTPQIIYTGKLLGYFRVPSRQSSTVNRCPVSSRSALGNERPSEAADKFLGLRREKYKDAILVGTGDNFAPQLEARVFEPAPPPKAGFYPKGNKELFFGDRDRWVEYAEVNEQLRKRLAQGLGTIPNDNVGCFLAAAQYAAVVPGKHDFYFGAERVRQFARFMAGIKSEGDYKPVQMLGANLVLNTVPIEAQPISLAEKEKHWFKTDWPKDYAPLNLSDGQSVYPWLSYVKIKLAEFKPDHKIVGELKHLLSGDEASSSEKDLKDFVGRAQASGSQDLDYLKDLFLLSEAIKWVSDNSLYICASTGNPNDVAHPEKSECGQPLKPKEFHFVGNAVAYYFPLLPIDRDKGRDTDDKGKDRSEVKNHHFSTLKPGQNYALCGIEGKSGNPYCLRFATYTPFFYFPHQMPLSNPDEYTDPDPFVLTEDGNTAIFGVVDTNLGEQVGILNFGWQNTKDKNTKLIDTELKTLVSAEDPAEALREQLDYFERWHQETKKRAFTGLKVLLAQTSPQRARVLAARFQDFQVVVSAADQEQGTSETTFSTVWTRDTRAGAFVAVPSPAFDTDERMGMLHFSSVEASQTGKSWSLSSKYESPVPIKRPEGTISEKPTEATPLDAPKETTNQDKSNNSSAPKFWQLVRSALSTCWRAGLTPKDFHTREDGEILKWLTLCAMREKTNADVALIQKRDLFDQLPSSAGDAPEKTQQILERLIWKGDLLTLIYVPGGALKTALKQSDTYVAEESSALSLVDERSRKLETLGIVRDSATKEYLINEAPIDDKKIYAVAATDYVGAGDTGYPVLAAAALNPRTYPAGFPEKLDAISSVVCRKLYPITQLANQYCLESIDRHKYLDESVAQEVVPFPQPSSVKKLWNLFPFKWPHKSQPATATSTALQERVQQRPIWTLSLRNFSLGFSSLDNNLTDAQIAQKFAGVPTSGVTARKTHTVTVGLNTRFSRSSHRNEFFFATGIDFKEQSTGDAAPQIVQINNRLTGDVGFIRNIRGGRAPSHLGVIFTLHAETPLQRPFTTFTLGTQDRLKITQDRGVLLLPRIGLRWQNRSNSLELGAQAGKEIDALSGYRFDTGGSIVECLPSATETFAACISRLSKPPITSITKDSAATAILRTRPRAGLYWKFNLSIPFDPKVKYELNQEADFFFNFRQDNATDTRYRDISKHSLKFSIWPSFSIGPSLQLLFYQNKVNRDFLVQKQFGLEASVGFDLFNRREKGVQIRHKP